MRDPAARSRGPRQPQPVPQLTRPEAMAHDRGRMRAPRFLLPLFVLVASARATGGDTPHYTLRYDAARRTMQVALCLGDAAPRVRFSGDADAAPYLGKPTRERAPPLLRDGDGWVAAGWQAGECLHYRAALGRLAAAQRHRGVALPSDTVITDPQQWLLQVADATAADVRVELPDGYAISTPWQPLPQDRGMARFRIARTPADWLARVAIGRFAETPIALDGGTLHVAVLGKPEPAQRARLLAWLRRVAQAALSAYGHLPLPDVQVLVVPVGAQREAVVFGQSTRGQGNALTLFVDPARSAGAFDRGWVAVHELSHLFHPYLGDRGAWLAEGLATYYQNVLRARAGLLTPGQAWAALDDGFTRGRRDLRGDSTLEAASARMGEQHDFQRIYWSGAAYWLAVDVELRRASANRLGIDEALRRFGACCLPSGRRWAPDEFVARLDTLIGRDAFSKTFRDYRVRRDFPDLDALYAALGIRRDGDALHFDERARDADIRRAIMRTVDTQ